MQRQDSIGGFESQLIMNKEASDQVKTQIEGIAERASKEVLGQAVLNLLNSDGHCFSKRPCMTCRTVSELVGQPFGCVKKALPKVPVYLAEFLWPHEKGSVGEAGYEFANAKTEAYRQELWAVLLDRIKDVERKKPSILNQCDYVDVADLPDDAIQAYREYVTAAGMGNGTHWSHTIGESGEDSVVESYIGAEKRKVIDDALIAAGLSDGDIIDLVFSW